MHLQLCDLASNTAAKRSVMYVLINLRCADSVCLYRTDFVCVTKLKLKVKQIHQEIHLLLQLI